MIPPVDQPKGELDEKALKAAWAAINPLIAEHLGVPVGRASVQVSGISTLIAEPAIRAYINALATKQAEPTVAENVTVAPAQPQATTVGVKALEWVKHPTAEAWRCDTIVGLYQVFAIVTPGTWTLDGPVGRNGEGSAETADEAKAAAQADYEARIRSALTAIPAAGPPAGELAGWTSDWVPAALREGKEVNVLLTPKRDKQHVTPLYLAASPAVTERVQALTDVAAERERQKSVEGWTAEHDDEHANGELSLAAACYAAPVPIRCEWPVPDGARSAGEGSAAFPPTQWLSAWPWDDKWWKPTDRRRDLVKAGALILAEIERLDRAALKDTKP